MWVVLLNQIVLINSTPMKGNKLKCDLYIYIVKVFCSDIRQRIYATVPLHTNNLIVRVIKYINHRIIITAFIVPSAHFGLD